MIFTGYDLKMFCSQRACRKMFRVEGALEGWWESRYRFRYEGFLSFLSPPTPRRPHFKPSRGMGEESQALELGIGKAPRSLHFNHEKLHL
jgi:hypothetical protein